MKITLLILSLRTRCPYLVAFLVFSSIAFQAQIPHQHSSSEILQEMQGLKTLGSVLYLAAHPDDENTRFISYCANELHMRTAYLSITRGDGGQNLIGKEIGPELGLIRTNELMAARGVDGGVQYFTPAKDFGYSKSPEETMAIWGEQDVLQDVVRVIRDFRPDIIVCRFPTDGGGGHGHHTASAMLAEQAFSLAADPAYATEALQGYPTWQAKRIVVNTGRWWNKDISADNPGVVVADVGAYIELLGTSCNELAAKSRSMHKSQGFGSTGVRGSQLEYFEHMAGEEAQESLFDGVDASWSRMNASNDIQEHVNAVIRDYNANDPSASIPGLLNLKKVFQKASDPYWSAIKIQKIDELIRDCMGLYVELRSDAFYASPGDSLRAELEITCRTIDGVKLISGQCDQTNTLNIAASTLKKNEAFILPIRSTFKKELTYTSPYWMDEEGSLGRYTIKDKAMLVKPVAGPSIIMKLNLEIDGEAFSVWTPLIQKDNDPVKGELWKPFTIGPEMTVKFAEENLFILSDKNVKSSFVIKAEKDISAKELSLGLPEKWKAEPANFKVPAMKKGESLSYDFTVNTSLKEAKGSMSMKTGTVHVKSLRSIDYDHIPSLTVIKDAQVNLVKMNVNRAGGKIGYIPGAGDKVAESLTSLGYEVELLDEFKLKAGGLEKYKAIITGIRLFNVDEKVSDYVPILDAYCMNGGNVILQYNTRHEMKTEEFSPYKIHLSRDRVTEEDAEVKFLEKDHAVMLAPNAITVKDFEDWVQERGLYFPDEWGNEFKSILSWHDKGESAKDGALLIAPYGKGNFIYTGISFFRELPAGVPGAYRLMVNMIELPAHD
jgi:LmbE family N-acetylglucosaminyl deacetylase